MNKVAVIYAGRDENAVFKSMNRFDSLRWFDGGQRLQRWPNINTTCVETDLSVSSCASLISFRVAVWLSQVLFLASLQKSKYKFKYYDDPISKKD